MRFFLAILIGKLIAFISRLFHIGGGSAAPGLYALKICPDLVEKLAGKIPRNVIITGTNGKTTTARILAHLANEAGLKIIRNSTGSNLERGIASALINYSSIGSHVGIWEMDEFAFNEVAPKIKPDVVLFLNVSRDQLDRYGEIDKVINRWCKTISKFDKKTIVLINSDLTKLKEYFKVKQFPEPKNIKTNGLSGSEFELSIVNLNLSISLPIPGLYNIQNCVAAITAAYYLNLPLSKLHKSLMNFSSAFGRVEKIVFPHLMSHRTPTPEIGYIFLIKNPAGATAVFETIAQFLKPYDKLLFALNDNFADGTDVSWIWDTNFPSLLAPKERGNLYFCSGTRAYDLAIRLKYAGFEPKSITVEPSLKKALKEARSGLKGTLYILPTYTAMLELQKILTKNKIKKHYWEENNGN